ncbi:uncharacterized protein LOC135461924 [Liolophura sinensis]|uniref:uncharacterized protein LOC135461924 n=1 Tax=Liolophura sinensis TaxID=3198878 RepID=UPI0031594A1E
MSTENLPPAPLPVKDKYRIRVISPDVVDEFACVKEIIVGFCRYCPTGNTTSIHYQSPSADSSASPCAETVREELPVSENVTYNVTGLNPYSNYKVILYPEGGRSSPGTVVTAQTSIEESIKAIAAF